MSILKYPGWQKACAEALLEDDPQRVRQRVIAAEAAIFARLQELTRTPENFELEAIEATLGNLRQRIASVPGAAEARQNVRAAAAKP